VNITSGLSFLMAEQISNFSSNPATGWLCVLLVVSAIAYSSWKSHQARQAAKMQVGTLSRQERGQLELQILERLKYAESLPVEAIAQSLNETPYFAVEIIRPLFDKGQLSIVPPEGQSVADRKLDRSSQLALTTAGEKRLNGKTSVVYMNNFGDTIHLGDGSMVTNRSTVSGSYNHHRAAIQPEVALLISQLAAAVSQSGNRDAQDNMDALVEETQRPEPRPAMMRSLLNGIGQALPTATQISELLLRLRELVA
jgi:hypothetical protein